MSFYAAAMAGSGSFDHLPAAVQAALAADLTIDITTIGRRTRLPKRIEIWFLNVGGTIYITGSPGKRDWFANLLANPHFIFHLKESATADLRATATVVHDLDERRRIFEAASASWYLEQDDLADLLAHAPTVRVTFD